MEPLKINVEVSLNPDSLKALTDVITSSLTMLLMGSNPNVQQYLANAAQQSLEKAESEAAPAEQQQEAEPAKEEKKEITTQELFDKTAKAKAAGVSTADIKKLFKETFGITSSRECPAERRQELLDALEDLIANKVLA